MLHLLNDADADVQSVMYMRLHLLRPDRRHNVDVLNDIATFLQLVTGTAVANVLYQSLGKHCSQSGRLECRDRR